MPACPPAHPVQAHLPMPYLGPICRKLGIDFAPALTGFERRRGGKSVPVIEASAERARGWRRPAQVCCGWAEAPTAEAELELELEDSMHLRTPRSRLLIAWCQLALVRRRRGQAACVPPVACPLCCFVAPMQGVVVCEEFAGLVRDAYAEEQR